MADQRNRLRNRPASCDGKERYPTAVLAHRVIKRRHRKDAQLSAYRCQHCGSFHIGTQRRDANRRRREADLGTGATNSWQHGVE